MSKAQTTAVATLTVDDKETVARKQTSILIEQINSMSIIENDEQFTLAGEYLKHCAKARSIIEAETNPIKDAAHKAWKAVCDKVKDWTSPVDVAERHWRNLRSDYQRRIAEENARVKAEAERLQREAEEAAAKKHAAEVKKAEKKGIEAPPPPIVAPVIPAPALRETPKTGGITQREVWRYEVTDFMALVKAVAEWKENINCLLPNDKLFGAQVKVLKDQFVVTGVKAVRDFSDAVRK